MSSGYSILTALGPTEGENWFELHYDGELVSILETEDAVRVYRGLKYVLRTMVGSDGQPLIDS